MKKVIVWLFVFAMAMTLAACGVMEAVLPTIIAMVEAENQENTEMTEVVEETQETTEVIEAEDETQETTEVTGAIEEMPFAVIEAKDGFHDAGFVELIAGAEAAAAYTFTAENSEAVEWWVYVLDESFEEGFRYIKQVAEPVLVGDGTISVEAGQYVYVYCSANEFTTGEIVENAKLNITVE